MAQFFFLFRKLAIYIKIKCIYMGVAGGEHDMKTEKINEQVLVTTSNNNYQLMRGSCRPGECEFREKEASGSGKKALPQRRDCVQSQKKTSMKTSTRGS